MFKKKEEEEVVKVTEIVLDEGQVVEVEYDKQMVVDDIKAEQEQNEEELLQDTFNEDGIEELLGEGAEIDEYTEVN